MKRTRLAYPYIFVWMPLFIVAPMLFVAYYAFFDNGTFTTEYVKQVFSSTTYLPALWNSIWIALATTAVCLGGKRELLERRVSRELEELMTARGQYAADTCTLPVTETDERYAVAVAAPILSEGDVLGCVLFVAAHGDGPAGETERKLAQAVSGFLGKQMES